MITTHQIVVNPGPAAEQHKHYYRGSELNTNNYYEFVVLVLNHTHTRHCVAMSGWTDKTNNFTKFGEFAEFHPNHHAEFHPNHPIGYQLGSIVISISSALYIDKML
jgi:hypothetical protein